MQVLETVLEISNQELKSENCRDQRFLLKCHQSLNCMTQSKQHLHLVSIHAIVVLLFLLSEQQLVMQSL